MLPSSGASNDASISSSVVLPAPFGPISAVTLPAGASKSICSTARTAPKLRLTARAVMPPSGSRPATPSGNSEIIAMYCAPVPHSL
jgi:hypothetical protein